jgi:hypothetical protein
LIYPYRGIVPTEAILKTALSLITACLVGGALLQAGEGPCFIIAGAFEGTVSCSRGLAGMEDPSLRNLKMSIENMRTGEKVPFIFENRTSTKMKSPGVYKVFISELPPESKLMLGLNMEDNSGSLQVSTAHITVAADSSKTIGFC